MQKEILEYFEDIVSGCDDAFVMEFGACDGYHSEKMIKILRGVTDHYLYHLFEPNEDLLESIYGRTMQYFSDRYGKVDVFPIAIGAQNGVAKFFKSGGQKVEGGRVVDRYYGSSSIRKPKLMQEDWVDMTFTEHEVEVITLDSHLARQRLTGRLIDFIWADIQGAEVDLINGGRQAFENVRYFYTEFSNKEYYEGQSVGIEALLNMLPWFEVVENYGSDVLLKNVKL